MYIQLIYVCGFVTLWPRFVRTCAHSCLFAFSFFLYFFRVFFFFFFFYIVFQTFGWVVNSAGFFGFGGSEDGDAGGAG